MVRQARMAQNQPLAARARDIRPPDEDLDDLRFWSLLTKSQWDGLPPDVRRRFSKRVKGGATAVFIGHLVEQRANAFGRLLVS